MERRRLQCGLTVDVATTEAEWQRGLSGEIDIHILGMLFVFDDELCWAVTTEKMRIGLYGYWLDRHQRIVAICKMPKESSVLFTPLRPARYLLEVIPEMPWQMGQRVRLEAVHESPRLANAHSGAAQRIDDESAVLEHEPDR